MIKGLMGSQGVTVLGGDTALPYIPMNNENPIQGMIRVHGTDLQVFNGSMWTNLSTSYATVALDPHTQDLLKWVEAQRTIAFNRMKLAQENPALMKALEAVKRAEDNFELLEKIITSEQRPL
jgi:hypothetical protein